MTLAGTPSAMPCPGNIVSAPITPSLSGGGAGAGRVLGQDAELVALRIGERDPATAIGPAVISEVRSSQREDPLHLLFAGAIGRAQVKVHPVLDLLTVGDGDEQQE